MKLSLCMIVKPSNEEAELLDRALESCAKYMDEICITQAGEKPNKKVSEVILKYGGSESFFRWRKDFAAARNYNFKQATGDFIFWIDSDDVVRNVKKLKEVITQMNPSDRYIMMEYLYDFDENNSCIVKHKKIRVIKNDGSFKWEGKLHEDLVTNIQMEGKYTGDIEILHLLDKEMMDERIERNIQISKQAVEETDDPRDWFNYANSLKMGKRYEQANETYKKFIELSKSDDEKYLAYLRIAENYYHLDDIDHAYEYCLYCIGLRPWYPDVYTDLGYYSFMKEKYEHAKTFLLMGLSFPVPEASLVQNPRDYSLNPLELLAKVYFKLGKFEEAAKTIEEYLKYRPDDKGMKEVYEKLKKETDRLKIIDEYLAKLKNVIDKNKIKAILDKIPKELQDHPKVCHVRNIHFIKIESSGKDITFYCSTTAEEWSPESVKKGIGGAEEAVINLAQKWADMGWNVTVYNNCGHKAKKFDGVTYKPFWMWNYRDKTDITIMWRHPFAADYPINTDKLYLDVHDCLPPEEFLENRLKRIDKIFVKTKAHRKLFPKVPDDKFLVIPNGLDPKHFEKKPDRIPKRCIWTSSPDRGLEGLIDMWPEIKKKHTEAELHFFYGWYVWDEIHKDNEEMKEAKERILQKMEDTEGVFNHDRVGHEEIAQEYMKADLFLYPTEFYEIHCISAAKAQAAGAIPLTTNYAALDETVQWGEKLPISQEPRPGPIFNLEEKHRGAYIALVDGALKNNISMENGYRKEMSKWSIKTNNWEYIANQWDKEFKR